MTENPDLGAVARGVIDANRYMTIGTADQSGRPWVSPVWYATADYRDFFWVSDPEARHSRNLAARPEVSIVIYDSHEAGGWKSVYLSATAGETSGGELDRGIEIFSSRSLAQGLPEWTHDDVRPPARRRLYRATAAELFVLSPGDERLPVDLRPA